jgi:hypothetical protein
MTLGLCWCGCGGKPKVSKFTDRCRGRIKGQSMRWISGHNTRRDPRWHDENWLKRSVS